MLKAAFPVDVLSPLATYEVQWGNVQRPTHRNTSWDWARFETVAQKWVDLSEGGYGVGLLNDCKYGHDIHDNVMRISLLRAPTSPDPEADQGEHHFVYGLVPHDNPDLTGVMRAAYALNDPLIVVRGDGGEGQSDLRVEKWVISVRSGHHMALAETVKQAEDGNGIIVRLYENKRMRGSVQVRTGFPIREAYITNLLEENQERLEAEDNKVNLNITPFQIVTVRLIPDLPR